MLRSVDDLPTLPSVVFDLERALQDETYGASEVAFIIEEDMSLTANILKLVNSAYYGTRGTIVTTQEAVARLGFKEVGRLVTTLGVIHAFKNTGHQLDHKEFWRHSLTVGFASRILADALAGTNNLTSEEAFVTGLLHDVGVLILDQYFAAEFEKIQNAMEQKGCSRAEAELDILETDHGEVGGYLLDIWNFPLDVIEAVTWHHRLDGCAEEFKRQTLLVASANTIGNIFDSDMPREERPAFVAAHGAKELGISEGDLQTILVKTEDELQRSTTFMSLL